MNTGLDADGVSPAVGEGPLPADFQSLVADYRTRIEHTTSVPQRLHLEREASRELIRATHTLCADGTSGPPQTLEEQVALFVQHYPAMRIQIAFFLFEARNPSAECEPFLARLDAFTTWMVSQQG